MIGRYAPIRKSSFHRTVQIEEVDPTLVITSKIYIHAASSLEKRAPNKCLAHIHMKEL